MKCEKSDTDQKASVSVYANGLICAEYILPNSDEPRDPSLLECFIPVSEGDHLTVKGQFHGTCVHGAIDLLADGAFLTDKRSEGHKDGSARYWKRQFEINKVLNIPKTAGYSSLLQPKETVEGHLHVKSLPEGSRVNISGSEIGVGSLAVVISVNQKSEDNYQHHYAGMTCGEWAHGDDQGNTAGIDPTHELEVKVTERNVHAGRAGKHRRHFEQTRFGNEPWATFIFHYRSRAAIVSAGCIPRPDRVLDLSEALSTTMKRSERRESEADGRSLFVSPSPDGIDSEQYGQSPLTESDEIRVGPIDKFNGDTPEDEMENEHIGPVINVASKPGSSGNVRTGESNLTHHDTIRVAPINGFRGTRKANISEIDHPGRTDRQSDLISSDQTQAPPIPTSGTAAGYRQSENEPFTPVPVKIEKTALTPSSSSFKHPLSAVSGSRESTPNSKRLKLSDLEAKKAALIAANKEKMQRKLAREKEMETERKKADELQREIEELEQEGMALDAELADMEED